MSISARADFSRDCEETVIVLEARNADEMLPLLIHELYVNGVRRGSRNGEVWQLPEPCALVFLKPEERVVFHSQRDANPFFHFYESLWMLAGRRDVAPLTRYVARMAEFSDDGKTFNAAYGHRWRHAREETRLTDDGPWTPDRDQLPIICNALRRNRDDRQQVLQIWDHKYDLGTTTRDHACNLIATFQVSPSGFLDMTVLNRSNDAIWGALGANVVHFSMLMEYVAARSGYPIGVYTHVSSNMHGYVKTLEPLLDIKTTERSSRYEMEPVYAYPIACDYPRTDFDAWDLAVEEFVRDDGRAPSGLNLDAPRWFAEVAWPIVKSHDAYKSGDMSGAKHALEDCEASDWKLACQEWLDRRQVRRLEKHG